MHCCVVLCRNIAAAAPAIGLIALPRDSCACCTHTPPRPVPSRPLLLGTHDCYFYSRARASTLSRLTLPYLTLPPSMSALSLPAMPASQPVAHRTAQHRVVMMIMMMSIRFYCLINLTVQVALFTPLCVQHNWLLPPVNTHTARASR